MMESAGTWRRRRWSDKGEKEVADDVECVHSQVLKIRAEDSNIGEDNAAEIFRKLSAEAAGHVASVLLVRRPILPASPLGERPHHHNIICLRN
ncbi:hypothetical protein DM860_005120 [Cuscuta australis]|uniref:Uncharacterized protein n=1 Tax=Cuscuta australis TaxID=267555 RepID=A0A328DRI8_9ASTE|nr:hypothetical protein DM860_005120 [Cuscuta australis]